MGSRAQNTRSLFVKIGSRTLDDEHLHMVSRLTTQDIADYHEYGFIFARDLFDAEEVDLLGRAMEQDPAIAAHVTAARGSARRRDAYLALEPRRRQRLWACRTQPEDR
ncbi:MAG: hypothetical protein CM1200mP20_12920 [Pseudomonadota bacterium]|nr:MAG: hypothetical protein CM1200mP20_12920 [Pseudomonadota bacterium]